MAEESKILTFPIRLLQHQIDLEYKHIRPEEEINFLRSYKQQHPSHKAVKTLSALFEYRIIGDKEKEIKTHFVTKKMTYQEAETRLNSIYDIFKETYEVDYLPKINLKSSSKTIQIDLPNL
jgi:hypothetical protein